MTVVVVTRDLMDGGRFRAARPDAVVVTELAAVPDTAAVIVLDLAAGIDPATAVALGAPVVAYGAHVDRAALDDALDAGCVEALPRSRVFRRIADLGGGPR